MGKCLLQFPSILQSPSIETLLQNFGNRPLEITTSMPRSNQLTKLFRSIKKKNTNHNPNSIPTKSSTETPCSSSSNNKAKQKPSWFVYLIISTNPPIKTYTGSTSDFSRRFTSLDEVLSRKLIAIEISSNYKKLPNGLKQHNGELSGGAKASRAGRPWICACLISGFENQSEACVFETKWKSISKKLPRKRKNAEKDKEVGDGSLMLLQHRQAALSRVKCLIDCTHLEIDWQLSPL